MARAAPTLDGWLTTEQVAERFGVPNHRVLRMIRTERLKATKLGWIWLIHETDLPETWPPGGYPS